MFELPKPLTKDSILQKVSEEDIFARYLGIYPDYQRSFKNPLRTDTNPGCVFYINSHGRIKFKDYGGHYDWDCFNVVEKAYGLTFKEALKKVAGDYSIEGVQPLQNVVRQPKEKLQIRVKFRAWNKEDKEYWKGKYQQSSKELEAQHTFPISHTWFLRSNGILELFYVYKHGDPAYAYCFPNNEYKIYLPKRPKGQKFRQSNGEIVQGLDLLPEKGHILIITKSMKDVICMRKFSKVCDFYSIAPMSETQLIPQEVIDNVKQRFDYVFTLFDFDRAGIKLMRKYEEAYELYHLMFGYEYKVQGIKDFADHLEIKGIEETENLIKELYGRYIC